MMLKKFVTIVLVVLASVACEPTDDGDADLLLSDNNLLPEKLKAKDETSGMIAQYIYPTSVYKHGILGDTIEAEGIRVVYQKKFTDFILDNTMVFEDIKPRLADLDNDGLPEIITILSSITKGASITIFKLIDGDLQVYASTGFIGTPYRWLNIAAIDDLDNNGTIEFAFVSTPHIGGWLHIGRIEKDAIYSLAQQPGVSNHQIGSRNLCLSAIGVKNGLKTLYLPSNDFSRILGFQWKDETLIAVDTIDFTVNPLIPLSEQYSFEGLQTDKNCISGQ